MKKIAYFISLVIVIAISFQACKSEDDFNPLDVKIASFQLVPTVAGRLVNIAKTDTVYTSKDTLKLDWERTHADNGTPVYYSAVFAGVDGSFDEPAYTLQSNTLGWTDSLNVSPQLLDIIAEKCGIKPLETGTIRWKVKAGNGVVNILSSNESSFQLTRPEGYASYPIALYMLGSATEAGDTLEAAIKGSNVGSGVFEFITTLKSGSFYFVDKKKEGATKYQINAGVISNGSNSVSTFSTSKLYRIKLSFYNAKSTQFDIQKMELIIPNKTSSATSIPTEAIVISKLTYSGAGVWEVKNLPALKPDNTDITNGTQYKFRMTVLQDGKTTPTEYFYGYYTDTDVNANAGIPNSSSPESWYYCKEGATLDRSYYRFGNTKGKKLDVAVYLTPGLKNYYHKCTILEE